MSFEQLVGHIWIYKGTLLTLGNSLRTARGNYKELIGEGVSSWADFLAQPEVGLTVREANSLIELAEWVEHTNLPLRELNLATAKFCAQKGILDPSLVPDMQTLSLKDFKDQHYESVKGVDAPRTYTYMVMKRCNETGNLSKVHGVEEQEIKSIVKEEDGLG